MRYQRLASHIGLLIMFTAGLAFALGAVITLDLGTPRRLGPGAFPLLVGSLLSGLAVIGLIQNLRAPVEISKPDVLGVVGVLAGGASFAFFTPLLGVIPATSLAVFATATAISGLSALFRLLLAVCVACVVWLIFVVGLGMPFVAFQRP